jgi:prepilin-type processing-associated H-X9-DG protein
MIALVLLARQREVARMAGCRRNLMQVGIALELYDQSTGCLPAVPRLAADPPPTGGPLKALLEVLALPDLTELKDVTDRPQGRPGQVPGERPVPGFVCPSDPNGAGPSGFPAPVSYRATAGDRPDGMTGGFAPARTSRLDEIEAHDGRSFTAAFSERLLGTHQDGDPRPVNYLLVAGPVGDQGCPAGAPGGWRGDAGSSWAEASWRSTLYNHSVRPAAAVSCVAADGVTAGIGVSSGHVGGVNVLHFDGSVRTIRTTVDPQVWKGLSTTLGGSEAETR